MNEVSKAPEIKQEVKSNELKDLKQVNDILANPANAEKLKWKFSENLEKELTKSEWLKKVTDLSWDLKKIDQKNLAQEDKDWLADLWKFLNNCLQNNEKIMDTKKDITKGLRKLDNGMWKEVNIDENKIVCKDVSLDSNNNQANFKYDIDWNEAIFTLKDDKISLVNAKDLKLNWEYYSIKEGEVWSNKPFKLEVNPNWLLDQLKSYKSDKKFDIVKNTAWDWYDLTFTVDEWYQKPDFTSKTAINNPLDFKPKTIVMPDFNKNIGLNNYKINTDILTSWPTKIAFKLDANGKLSWTNSRELESWHKLTIDDAKKTFKIDSPKKQEVKTTTTPDKTAAATTPDKTATTTTPDKTATTTTPEVAIDSFTMDWTKVADKTFVEYNKNNPRNKFEGVIGAIKENKANPKATELINLLKDWKLQDFQTQIYGDNILSSKYGADWKFWKETLDTTRKYLETKSTTTTPDNTTATTPDKTAAKAPDKTAAKAPDKTAAATAPDKTAAKAPDKTAAATAPEVKLDYNAIDIDIQNIINWVDSKNSNSGMTFDRKNLMESRYITKNDPKIDAMILYYSMKWAGTADDIIWKVLNLERIWKLWNTHLAKVYEEFSKISPDEDLVKYIKWDYDNYWSSPKEIENWILYVDLVQWAIKDKKTT